MPEQSASRATVTVSIVSHGQWTLVRQLLDDLNAHVAGSIAHVVLTVNRPETIDLDPRWRIPVLQIDNPAPKGFGANHNAAFAHCRTTWFLVLNPDMRIDQDLLGALMAHAGPEVGLLAPRVLEPDRAEPEPFRGLLTPAELFRRRRQGHQPPPAPSWIAGMFMLLRSESFTQIQGFDDRFFMYCEDVDLCVRLQLAGWRLQIATDLTVLHDARRDSHSSFRPLMWHLTSLIKLWTAPAFWRYLRLQRTWGKTMRSPMVVLHAAKGLPAP